MSFFVVDFKNFWVLIISISGHRFESSNCLGFGWTRLWQGNTMRAHSGKISFCPSVNRWFIESRSSIGLIKRNRTLRDNEKGRTCQQRSCAWASGSCHVKDSKPNWLPNWRVNLWCGLSRFQNDFLTFL